MNSTPYPFVLLLLLITVISRSASCQVYDTTATTLIIPTAFPSPTDDEVLDQLREYDPALNNLASKASDQLGLAMALLDWTHNRWKHNGSNTPSAYDPITILNEAKSGKKFRCVEYGIVSAGLFNAFGLPARVVGLKTKKVETKKYGAGHVLAEVWLPDLEKWVVADGQFNAIPFLNEQPLNAAELGTALRNKARVTYRNAAGQLPSAAAKVYTRFVTKYLYYIDTNLDQRSLPRDAPERITYKGNKSIMLVPVGAKYPTVFQRKKKISSTFYTENIHAFYGPPV